MIRFTSQFPHFEALESQPKLDFPKFIEQREYPVRLLPRICKHSKT